jgi:hypothetical protein
MKYRTRLAALLNAKGLTRGYVVSQTSIPYPTILRWETEVLDRIDPRHLQEILGVLRCDYADLVFPVEE